MTAQLLHPSHPVNTPAVIDDTADHIDAGRRLAGCVRNPDGTPSQAGIEAGRGCKFNVPILDVSEADTTRRVYQVRPYRAQNVLRAGYGVTIPWSDKWWSQIPTGGDGTICIHNEATGEWWELWVTERDRALNAFVWENLTAGWGTLPAARKVAVADIHRHPNIHTMRFDPRRSGQPGSLPADIRGCGLPKVGTILLEELDAGRISHAIAMTVCNTGPGYMPGTATRSEYLVGTAAGVDIGNRNVVRKDSLRSGERLVLSNGALLAAAGKNTALLDGWTAAVNDPKLHRTWGIIADALAEYGLFAAETCGWGAHAETNWQPATAGRWDAHGISTADRNTPLNRLLTELLRTPDVWRLARPSA